MPSLHDLKWILVMTIDYRHILPTISAWKIHITRLLSYPQHSVANCLSSGVEVGFSLSDLVCFQTMVPFSLSISGEWLLSLQAVHHHLSLSTAGFALCPDPAVLVNVSMYA